MMQRRPVIPDLKLSEADTAPNVAASDGAAAETRSLGNAPTLPLFLELPCPPAPDNQSRDHEERSWPRVIGYQISALLGEGGMGTVYRARQLSTGRDVALKVIRQEAMTSTRVRGLFAQEVRLAARLQHPNVVRIYDSGIDCGLYYYAMELVDGITLDRYVNAAPSGSPEQSRSRLSRRQILELMRLICEGVQHAHLRGVIHRDLKPRNIVVTPDGQPHVLDFGLATAVLRDQAAAESPALSSDSATDQVSGANAPDPIVEQSHTGHIAGTPAFMSPEQARGRHDDLDVRTDVYSLGVILFLLLTGKMPSDVSGGAGTVMHTVAHEPILSPRAADSGLDGDLEALLLKALARKAENRYASAGAMGEDLGRYLQCRPLAAQPATVRYVCGKWLRRHRRMVAIAVITLLSVGSLSGYAWRSHHALQRTMVERQGYDQTLDRLIANLSPQVTGRQVGNRDLLNSSANDAMRLFQDRPVELARILDRIGVTLYDQGWSQDAEARISRAVELQRKAVGDANVQTVKCINDLAEVKRDLFKVSEAVDLEREAIAACAMLPPGDERAHEELRALMQLAYASDESGDGAAAEARAGEVLATSLRLHPGKPDDPDVLRARYTLAFILRDQGKLRDAAREALETLEAQRRVLTESHPDTLRTMDVYASILYRLSAESRETDSLEEAERWIDRALELSEQTLGPLHLDRLLFQNDRAVILAARRRFEDAALCLRAALAQSTAARGREYRTSVVLMSNLAIVLCDWARSTELRASERRERRQEAERLLKQIIDLRSAAVGADDAQVLAFKDKLAEVECALGKFAEAEVLCRATTESRRRRLGPKHPDTLASEKNLADVIRFRAEHDAK